MERTFIEKKIRQIEFYSFCGVLIFLPNSESLKQIAFYLCFAGALGWRFSKGPIKWRRPDTTEWLLIVMVFVSLVSTVINWPMAPGTKGIRNTICMTFLFWLMYRDEWYELQLKRFSIIAVLAVIVGLVIGIWEWSAGRRDLLEFHSAGIVTQSAIYLGVAIFLILGILVDRDNGFSASFNYWNIIFLIFCIICLLLMGSRGGILAVFVSLCVVFCFIYSNKRLQLSIVLGILATGFFVAYCYIKDPRMDPFVRIKHLIGNFGRNGLAIDGKNDLLRFDHWRLGYTQATSGGSFLFGIGPRNFTSIRVESLKFNRPLETYKSMWTIPQHAHNLFLTKWCEEGLVGLTGFVLFLMYIGISLFRYRPGKGGTLWKWTACVGALVVPVIAGLFNSPFGNEFSWLAMILMGLWMGSIKNMDQQMNSKESMA